MLVCCVIASELAPAKTATLRLRAGSHEVRRIVSAEQASDAPRNEYELRVYEELYTLPLPDGRTHSLFGPDGPFAHAFARSDTRLALRVMRRRGAFA